VAQQKLNATQSKYPLGNLFFFFKKSFLEKKPTNLSRVGQPFILRNSNAVKGV
jgi:hypothetical protein